MGSRKKGKSDKTLPKRGLLTKEVQKALFDVFEENQRLQRERAQQLLRRHRKLQFLQALDFSFGAYLDSYNELFDSIEIAVTPISVKNIYSEIEQHISGSFHFAGATLRAAFQDEKSKSEA